MSNPRPPSAELDWSDIASIEETAGESGDVGAPNVLALCRTIRALCVERDRRIEEAERDLRMKLAMEPSGHGGEGRR